MKTKHTSGGWELDFCTVNVNRNKVEWISLISGDKIIAEIKGRHYGVNIGEMKANAKLISLAPKMLQSLIDLRQELLDGSYNITSPTILGLNDLIKQATS